VAAGVDKAVAHGRHHDLLVLVLADEGAIGTDYEI